MRIFFSQIAKICSLKVPRISNFIAYAGLSTLIHESCAYVMDTFEERALYLNIRASRDYSVSSDSIIIN